jgi:hypothetical protein
MANVQLAIAGDETTQVILSVPGVQGPAGSNLPASGTTHQLLYKQSNTNYDTAWKLLTNDNVDAAAAIAGTKISPNFGSQNVVTTGTSTAASFIPTSSSVPANGLYLPSANNVAISTGGSGRLFVDASGNVGVGNSLTSPQRQLHILAPVFGANLTGGFRYGDLGNNYYVDQLITTDSSSNPFVETKFASHTLSKYAYGGGNNYWEFYTNNSPAMRITSTGTVNIVGAGSAGSTQAVSFNGSAPVNSLVLTSGGLLGVGVSDPIEKLVVAGATANIGIYNTTAGSTASPSYSRLNFYGYLQTALWNVASISAGNSASNTYGGILQFATNTAGGTHTTALTIDNQQQVGIGTASPSSPINTGKLMVQGGDIVVRDDNVGNAWNRGTLVFDVRNSNGDSKSAYIQSNTVADVSSTLQFFTTATHSLSERMRIDDAGRLLVGTSSARSGFINDATVSAAIQLEGAGGAYNDNKRFLSQTYNVADNYGPAIILAKSRSGSLGGVTVVQSDDEVGGMYFCGADGTDLPAAASIIGYVDGTPGANDMPGRLVFSTTADGASSPTPRMTITSGGALWLNTTTGTVGTTAFGTVFAGDGVGSFRTSRNVNGVDHVAIVSGNAGIFVVRGDGDCENTNNSYGALSDVKLKENIVNASSQWNDISALQVRNYNFKTETGYRNHTQIGLIAQEVELVSPGLVGESPDRDAEGNDLGTVTKSVNYSVLYMKAVKALQEAMERIELLEARLDAANL